MKTCFETRIALSLSLILFTASFFLAGCPATVGVLPEPATNVQLNKTEFKLDTLTEKRISRVSASVIVAREASNGLPPSKETSIVKGELDIAKASLGSPTIEDLNYAKQRASSNNELAYSKSIATAEALRQSIKEIDQKYEQEKAKKQAEYESGIKEKEFQIKAKQEELENARIEHANQRFMTWGGGLIATGSLIAFFVPIVSMKRLGYLMFGLGTMFCFIPFVSSEHWFMYSVGGIVLFIAISMLVYGIHEIYLDGYTIKGDTASKVESKLESPADVPPSTN